MFNETAADTVGSTYISNNDCTFFKYIILYLLKPLLFFPWSRADPQSPSVKRHFTVRGSREGAAGRSSRDS